MNSPVTGRPSRVEAFIRYLSANEIIDEAALRRAQTNVGAVDLRLGRIALLEGFVTPEGINDILWVQREAMNRKFGEIAVELGIMSSEEVRRSLELQNDEMFAFCQSVILDGLIAPQTLYAIVKTFLEESLEKYVEERRMEQYRRVGQNIRAVLKRISVVAPMPGTVARLMEMLNNPEVNLDDVAKVISYDVGLTAMILRLSNSAFYGLKSRVTSVSKAVTVLGTKKLRQLILSAAVMDNFRSLPVEYLNRFWECSMRTAQWSKELAQVTGNADVDEFFLAGFLHNIGELVLLQHFPHEMRKIEELTAIGRGQIDSELAVMGCDHTDVGSFLLSLWQLPKAVIQAAMLQHHPPANLQKMNGITPEAIVVNMAVAVVETTSGDNAFQEGMHLSRLVESYRSVLPLEYQRVKDMRDKVDQTVDELMRWFTA